jgi:hypothetical protein
MIRFFRENNGDFLAVDTATNRYYIETFGQDHFEGRATAIEGLVGSVCTTAVSRAYLRKNCNRCGVSDFCRESVEMIEGAKAAVIVSEMARMVGLSRARFYQLRKAGVFPLPVYDVATRRPVYTEEL